MTGGPGSAVGELAAPSRAARLWRRTRVGGALALGLALVLWLTSLTASSWPVLVIGLGLATLLAIEFARMGSYRELRLGPALLAGVAAVAAVGFAGLDLSIAWTYAAAAGAAAVAAFAVHALRGARGSGLLLALALGLWLLAPLPGLALVRDGYGHAGLVALLALSKIGDIAGYYGGSLMGRHHPFPRISPGKTTEGCLVSALAGVLAGAGAAHFGLLPGTWAQGLVAGLLINVAAQSGDLLESFVKRRAGVKDSGTWFGPSGGLFDLADSLLLTVPAALLLWPLVLGAGS